jgi:hypothetical protein
VFLRDPTEYVSVPSPENGNRSSFRNVVFSSFYNTGRWTKSKNPVILSTKLVLSLLKMRKYKLGLTTSGMIFIPSLMKICELVQHLLGRQTHGLHNILSLKKEKGK